MDNNKKLGFLPAYISWLTIALVIIAIITFFVIASPRSQYYVAQMGFGEGMMGTSDVKSSPPNYGGVAPMMDDSVTGEMMRPDYYPYPYPNPEVPITDTRELLKIYYGASMQTRDVPTLVRRVETTVRGYDGRIDSESSAEKYGYVSFALSQTKYDAFRDELEGLVGSRFLKVNISSQNLLSQKVSIEEQQKQADSALVDYKTARQKIVNAHISAVKALQDTIDNPNTSENERILLREQLAKENSSYTRNLNNADAKIKYAEDWVKGVQTQDATLLANIATVNGTVSIEWINLWELVFAYLPGYWIPFIFAVLAVLSFMNDRRLFRSAKQIPR